MPEANDNAARTTRAPARVLFLGGASCLGKSTVAAVIASRLGWRCIRTDSLARHPGRPWSVTRQAAVDYFLNADDVDWLLADVLAHYERIWPLVLGTISDGLADEDGLVVEGSSVLPHLVAAYDEVASSALWLTASPDHVARCIRRESVMGAKGALASDRQRATEAFLARAVRFNAHIAAEARRLCQTLFDVEHARSPDDMADRVLRRLASDAEDRHTSI